MSSIKERLKMILEGNNILLEAEEDKYDLENEEDVASEEEQPATSDQEPEGDESAEDSPNQDDSEDDKYGLEDEDDSGDQDDSSSTEPEAGEDSGGESSSISNEPKPGSLLNIDPKTRSILAFKNFDKYRDLRDDTSRLINELSEFVPTSDHVRHYLTIAIEKGSDLLEKLNDYILYKYTDNSYEINYHNFMQFLLEKRYLDELYKNIVEMSSKDK